MRRSAQSRKTWFVPSWFTVALVVVIATGGNIRQARAEAAASH
jgi:hypothetical protein